MRSEYEFAICGLGAYGSALLYELARRGRSVVGIDRYCPPHTFGSSHGESRITRLAIGEGEEYVPFALRSHELWRGLESLTGAQIMLTTGGLLLGPSGNTAAQHGQTRFLEQTIAAAGRYGIAHELLDRAAIQRRFPQFKVQQGESGYYEPAAGVVRPESAVTALLSAASRAGAATRLGERVEAIESDGAGVRFRTSSGMIRAERAAVCAGPWLPELLPELAPRLRVLRQVMYWLDISAAEERYSPGRFPIFIWLSEGETEMLYGFPALDGPRGGIKIASEQYEREARADDVIREVGAEEIAKIEELAAERFESVGRVVKHATCLYTATPDCRFAMGALPGRPEIYCVSACSGHGFKHAPAVGEAVAEILVGGRSAIDLAPFPLSSIIKGGS